MISYMLQASPYCIASSDSPAKPAGRLPRPCCRATRLRSHRDQVGRGMPGGRQRAKTPRTDEGERPPLIVQIPTTTQPFPPSPTKEQRSIAPCIMHPKTDKPIQASVPEPRRCNPSAERVMTARPPHRSTSHMICQEAWTQKHHRKKTIFHHAREIRTSF